MRCNLSHNKNETQKLMNRTSMKYQRQTVTCSVVCFLSHKLLLSFISSSRNSCVFHCPGRTGFISNSFIPFPPYPQGRGNKFSNYLSLGTTLELLYFLPLQAANSLSPLSEDTSWMFTLIRTVPHCDDQSVYVSNLLTPC